MTLKQKLDEIRERCEKARREVCDLASGKRQFTMNVPPQPDDTDMLICESLDRLPALLDALEISLEALEFYHQHASEHCNRLETELNNLGGEYPGDLVIVTSLDATQALTQISKKMGV